jgi:hypothetical protein
MTNRAIVTLLAMMLCVSIGVGVAQADTGNAPYLSQSGLVNCFAEPAWNVSANGPAPRYAITFGFALLYPNFCGSRAR